MENPNVILEARCPSCGGFESIMENPFLPYCSAVCRLLGRRKLSWKIKPCRIVVDGRPNLIVQSEPHFDLRESALRGARERALETNRKRRQRAAAKLRNVPPTAQYKPSITDLSEILAEEKAKVTSYAPSNE